MPQHKVNQEAYGILFEELMAGPCTTKDLAYVSGLTLLVVQSLIRMFRKRRIVRIIGYMPDCWGGDKTPLYVFGRGRDAPRRKMTHAERAANGRIRNTPLTTRKSNETTRTEGRR